MVITDMYCLWQPQPGFNRYILFLTDPYLLLLDMKKVNNSCLFCWQFSSMQMQTSQCTLEIVSTEEGTFNFWALEVTDLIENLFLLYSRRIICAENESLQDYKAPVSISPMLQRLSLSSVLWTTASRDHFRINREQYKKKTPESGWKRGQSLWFSKVKYRKSARGPD